MPVEDAAAEHAGPYRLLELLGEGGMGVVRRGVDHAGRDVAIKLLKPELAQSADFRRRLAREVDSMRRVRSPYVAEVLDADLVADRPYVVTRYIQGRPLDDVVRDGGPLTGEPLRRVAAGLADALVAIHDAGVVHRDLKPNNVMLVGGSPVVIDFGIAHVADTTRLTRMGQVVGTPGYMAPEIIDGVTPGPALDVYGWAATVTFAASGRSPFGSGSLESVLVRVAGGRPDLDEVPPTLEPLVRTALDRDPARRPSVTELVDRIRGIDLDATAADRQAALDRTAVATEPRPPLSLYKSLAYLSIVGAGLACAVLPFIAGMGTVVTGWYLRAGDSAVRSRRVEPRTTGDLVLAPARTVSAQVRSTALLVPVLAYAGLVAAAVGVTLYVRGRIEGTTGSGAATKWTAFVFAYMALAGPRIMGPRRQLVRLLSAAAPDRRSAAWAGLLIGTLTLGAGLAAWVCPPYWWPLPDPDRLLGRLADLVQRLGRHVHRPHL